MRNVPLVLTKVVNCNLCIGCGICVSQCPSNALMMEWDDYGFLLPAILGCVRMKANVLKVCPFNPEPDAEVQTENEIGDIFLTETKK